jgi:HEXXH motif-containing protein
MRRTRAPEATALHRRFARSLSGFVWAEQTLAGRPVDGWMVVTDDRGGLRCPSLGRFVELGPDYADQEVWIGTSGENAVIRCPDGLTVEVPPEDLAGLVFETLPTIEEHGYAIAPSRRVADGAVEVSNRDPWLRVRLTGTNQRTDGTSFFDVDESAYPPSVSLPSLEPALRIVKRYWPEAHDDLAAFTRVVVPLEVEGPGIPPTTRDKHFAFTVSSRQGAIFVCDAPVEPTIEMVIHENAHIKLRQVQALDPLLEDPLDETVRLPVPWRPDPRPLAGILEGVFVFSHIAEFELRRWRSAPDDVDPARLSTRMEHLRHAAEAVRDRARLTPHGRDFIRRMNGWIGNMQERLVNR